MSFHQQQQAALEHHLVALGPIYREAQRVRNDILALVRQIPSLQPNSGAPSRNTQSNQPTSYIFRGSFIASQADCINRNHSRFLQRHSVQYSNQHLDRRAISYATSHYSCYTYCK
jgi:hypothetical protein